MKRIKLFIVASAAVAGMALCYPASAQYFSHKNTTETVEKRPEATNLREEKASLQREGKTEKVQEDRFSRPRHNAELRQKMRSGQSVSQPSVQNTRSEKKDKNRRYSKVGGVIVEVTDDKPEDELILLKMSNFDVYQSPSGQTRCSARFSIISTLPTKISTISYRLKWQKMETVFTFNDVQPGIDNYYNYELLGDGCYTMDKRPNIIVNRCRVKGMSQRECARKIRWIKEVL